MGHKPWANERLTQLCGTDIHTLLTDYLNAVCRPSKVQACLSI